MCMGIDNIELFLVKYARSKNKIIITNNTM